MPKRKLKLSNIKGTMYQHLHKKKLDLLLSNMVLQKYICQMASSEYIKWLTLFCGTERNGTERNGTKWNDILPGVETLILNI